MTNEIWIDFQMQINCFLKDSFQSLSHLVFVTFSHNLVSVIYDAVILSSLPFIFFHQIFHMVNMVMDFTSQNTLQRLQTFLR